MTRAELVTRLTRIVKEQAEIIETQSEALARLGEVEGLEARIRRAAAERAEAEAVSV